MSAAVSGEAGSAQEAREHWVELRVHGVSGTPPESIMLTGFVRQVAGDDRGRFFRPADSLGTEQQQMPGRVLEAYHWGRFTSGSWTQALWLLIIPFGVINAAAFTLPPPRNVAGRVFNAMSTAALRLVGLAMTCLLIFSSLVVALDLFAWQTKEAGSGGNLRWWLIGALALPLAVLVLFYLFGQSRQAGQDPGQDRHNERGEDTSEPRINRTDNPVICELAKQDFFSGDPDAPALRRLHVAAALHMISAVLLWPTALAGSGVADGGRWTAAILLAVAAVTVFFLGDPERAGGHSGWHAYASLASRVQLLVALLLMAFAIIVVAGDSAQTVGAASGLADEGMPGIAQAAMALFMTVVFAIILLFIGTLGLALNVKPGGTRSSRDQAFKPFAGGMTAFLLGSVGAYLGVGFAAAFSFAAQIVVNRAAAAPVTVTRVLQRVAYAWGLTIILIAGMAVVGVVCWLVRRGKFEIAATAAFDLGALPPVGLPAAWQSKVALAMYMSRLKNVVPVVFSIFAGVGLLLSVVAAVDQISVQQSVTATDPRWFLGWLSELNGGAAGWLVWLGTTTLSALSVALVVLGRGALRAEKARRGVNVVWDVIAFWPRAVHPFVPPPYSQHVVAGLRRRISWHLGTLDDPTASPPVVPATRVVVAAHSQGSLITVAALLWLTPAERARVGVVTFGSQLQQQFARAFPAAVHLGVLDWVWEGYGRRWRNLYRDTDPIAGPVLSWSHRSVIAPGQPSSDNFDRPTNRSGAVPTPDPIVGDWGRRECGPEWRLLDPNRADLALMTGPMAVIRGHGDYPADPDWNLAVAAVLPVLPAPAVSSQLPAQAASPSR